MAILFFSYSHQDEPLRDELEKHLSMLKHEGVIEAWHDRRILAGDEFGTQIDGWLERANVVLLLVSADFLASKYCFDIEVKRAMERHEAGVARVIPVILRPCDWHGAPFGTLLAAPRDGKAISTWTNRDEAFVDVVRAIRDVLSSDPQTQLPQYPKNVTSAIESIARPRSSNLRLRKAFAEADRDRFLDDAFEFISRFFQNSLTELKERNQGIDVAYKRIDAHRFTSVVYRGGTAQSRCKIRLGGGLGRGASIVYSSNDSESDNSFNESLSTECDTQSMFLKPLGIASLSSAGRPEKLTFEGAAEYLWAMFIQPMQT